VLVSGCYQVYCLCKSSEKLGVTVRVSKVMVRVSCQSSVSADGMIVLMHLLVIRYR